MDHVEGSIKYSFSPGSLRRCPQQQSLHQEILLNTSPAETAVCNLGSVNLVAHVVDGVLDVPMLEETVRTAMDAGQRRRHQLLPNGRSAKLHQRHRPVGLGIMGFQDALAAMNISYASEQGCGLCWTTAWKPCRTSRFWHRPSWLRNEERTVLMWQQMGSWVVAHRYD